jgi:hypothetical protein
MTRTPESLGTCSFCDETVVKRSVIKHLSKCPQRLEKILTADAGARPQEKIWHLRVQAVGAKEYWLELEMTGSASLQSLDKYLRAIWLECCGHLSQFTVGGWGGTELGTARKANAVFEPGIVLRHLYDFGTTSETDIQALSFRLGQPLSKKPIYLMARNNPPDFSCQECGAPALWLCLECLYEDENTGFLCDEHVKDHPHDNYGEPMPVVNSPRMGMCGYEGPATPPY